MVGIIGKVGSGKSSLLSSITGDMDRTKGQVYVRDFDKGFALASQEPWIQHGTIRENIVFGEMFDERRYHHVLEACALTDDLRVNCLEWMLIFILICLFSIFLCIL